VNKAKDRNSGSNASAKCNICGQDNPPEARFCANCGAVLVSKVESPSETAVASSPSAAPVVAIEYMGGLIRFGAAMIDAVVVLLVFLVLSYGFGHSSFNFGFFPLLLVYHWLFTGLKGQTPGKMVFSIIVVDAQGNRPTLRVAALREVLGKVISTVGLCLGFLSIDTDKQKQGWHDKIASTYVVKVESRKKDEKEL
jgi:uncharacterized RDD family membrane protein YckC